MLEDAATDELHLGRQSESGAADFNFARTYCATLKLCMSVDTITRDSSPGSVHCLSLDPLLGGKNHGLGH